MFRLARPFLLLSLFLVASSSGSAQDKMVSTPYYPLANGTTWHYKIRDGSKFVMKVAEQEKVGDVLCARVDLITDAAKKEPVSEHLAVTADGVFRYSFSTAIPDKPVQVLKLPLKAGETWKVESKALGDTLKGTYKVGEEEEIDRARRQVQGVSRHHRRPRRRRHQGLGNTATTPPASAWSNRKSRSARRTPSSSSRSSSRAPSKVPRK